MDPADKKLLLDSGWLASLEPAAREEVAAAATARSLGAKEPLFHQGDPAAAMYFVAAGRLKLVKLGPDGDEIVIRFVGPGEICAALALLADTPYPVSGQAIEPTRVLGWPREALRRLAAAHPELALSATRAMAERMQEMQERFRELATERVAQRIARTLLRLARQTGRRVDEGVLLDLPLTRQDLAEMTGTTLFTVSRQLSEWEGQGIVAAGRGRVVIRSPHRLVALAEDLPDER